MSCCNAIYVSIDHAYRPWYTFQAFTWLGVFPSGNWQDWLNIRSDGACIEIFWNMISGLSQASAYRGMKSLAALKPSRKRMTIGRVGR